MSRYDTINPRLYVAMLTLWINVGVAVAAAGVYLTRDVGLNWMLLLGTFGLSVLGGFINKKSDNPVISLFSYGLVAISMGAMIGPIVAAYTTASVLKVLIITMGGSLGLGVLGIAFPQVLGSWTSYLYGGLMLLIFGSLAVIFAGMCGLPVGGAMQLLDFFGIVLFSGFVIYDTNCAMEMEHTHDNAIDGACSIFMDMINLFIRLLPLLGSSSSSSSSSSDW